MVEVGSRTPLPFRRPGDEKKRSDRVVMDVARISHRP
jgi:hypothetical protein